IAGVSGAFLLIAGVRHFYAWMTFFLSIFVAVCVLGEFWKGARTRMKTAGENFAQALYNLTMRNTRRYGGYVAHLGIVLLFIGLAGLAFKTEAKSLMQEGDLLRVKNYLLRCDGLASGDTPNYEYTRALITVTKDGRAFTSMHPE